MAGWSGFKGKKETREGRRGNQTFFKAHHGHRKSCQIFGPGGNRLEKADHELI